MRVLAIDFPLPGPSIDNFTFLNAPAFFDYDALIIDPRGLSQLIDDVVSGGTEHTSFSSERVVNVASQPGEVALSELLHNRVDETERLLTNGGLIVCLALPNCEHEGIRGLSRIGRYYWLPAPHGITYGPPFLNRGAGTEFAPVDLDHPLAGMLAQVKTKLGYQVHFADDPNARAVARSLGGATIAVEMSAHNGHIAFIPPPRRPLDSQGRYQVSEALQVAIRQLLHLSSASSAPGWVADYTLPGLEKRTQAHREATSRLAEAQNEVLEAASAVDELTSHQLLLWEEGRALTDAVRQALVFIDFRVSESDRAMTISFGDSRTDRQAALVEVAGSEQAVGLDAHYRIRRRLEEALARGSPQRGLLLVNGYRRTPPAEREQQFTNQLSLAAGELRYCLATTEDLYRAVQAKLRDDSSTVEGFRERLLTTDGQMAQD